jgi:uncharacterized protein (DUF433 family)
VPIQIGNVDGGRPFEIEPDNWSPLHRRIIGDFLGHLSRESYLRGRFLSSALVVDKQDRRPSRPFFDWLKQLGALPDAREDSALVFWLDQLHKAHEWFRTHGSDPVAGIEITPNVVGGDARIARTRVPVWILEQARRLGTSQAELLSAYPTLTPQDLANAWEYAQSHPEEMDRAILQNEEA